MANGKLIIVTGFVAAGKDTVLNEIIKANPEFHKVVTHTSRPRRKYEVHGKDYYFISKYEFRNLIKSDLMLEYAIWEKHYRGTHKDEIEVIFDNKTTVWRIDMQMAAEAENLFYKKYDKNTADTLTKNIIKIVLKSENKDIVFKRYRNRDPKSFNKESILRRLEKEENIFEKYHTKFPHIIENKTGQLDRTLRKIHNIINS